MEDVETDAECFNLTPLLREPKWVHCLFFFFPCSGKMYFSLCKIVAFLCNLCNFLLKDIIYFFFRNQISKWSPFERRVIFDLFFTFHISHFHKYTHFAYSIDHFCKNDFITYGFSLVCMSVIVCSEPILLKIIGQWSGSFKQIKRQSPSS